MIQWHPAFVAAMKLEFEKDKDVLQLVDDFTLNAKPLQIDLLLLKKVEGCVLHSELGDIFRKHNIVEYKSPYDALDEDVYLKTLAYACLYKSYGDVEGKISRDTVTITFIRDIYPEKLFTFIEEYGMNTVKYASGIYYIENAVLFPTQIIVGAELKKEDHIWLTALSNRLTKEEMRNVLINVNGAKSVYADNVVDSVLKVSIEANKSVVEELRGEYMLESLMELMKPEIDQMKKDALDAGAQIGKQEGIQTGIQTGLIALVHSLKTFCQTPEEVLEQIVKNEGYESTTLDDVKKYYSVAVNK